MRRLRGVLLLVFLGAVLLFAVQNTQAVAVRFLTWRVELPEALLIVAVYVLGMLSGWALVSFFGRALRRLSERQER